MDYSKHYNKLVERAKQRVIDGYTESHHIVPRCMGGTDDKSNLVDLTPEEHCVAHQLLVKIYPDNDSLVYAAHMMNATRQGNKVYAWLRKKRSELLKGNQYSKGQIQSKETKAKRSKSLTGQTRSVESKAKMSEAAKGRTHSAESKAKMSEARKGRPAPNKGKPHSEEQKEKMKLALKGRTLTEEHKAKIGRSGKDNAFFGRHHTEETKEKIRLSLRNRTKIKE